MIRKYHRTGSAILCDLCVFAVEFFAESGEAVWVGGHFSAGMEEKSIFSSSPLPPPSL